MEPPGIADPAPDIEALLSIASPSLVVRGDELIRGSLVEFKVRLKADPVFHLGTMVSEFSAMAEDFPEMFGGAGALDSLGAAQPVNKILNRLLAGLIPIRSVAVDYSVIAIDGVEYVVHQGAAANLGIPAAPLEIVGVTDHLAYWKDIRRVLFSNGEFTLLGRVARTGLDATWTPVKLADLFQQVAPDLVERINAASRMPFGTPPSNNLTQAPDVRFATALERYATAIVNESGSTLSEPDAERVALKIVMLKDASESPSAQRAAFRELRLLLDECINLDVSARRDLELRDEARTSAGISLFPSLDDAGSGTRGVATASPPGPGAGSGVRARLLDLEVIAIYW